MSLGRKSIPLAAILLASIGLFFLAIGQYGRGSWEFYGLSNQHNYYFLGKVAHFSSAIGYLLIVIGWGISVKAITSRIGVTAYVFAAIGFLMPITVEFLYALQISWDNEIYFSSDIGVWTSNWSSRLYILSYLLLGVATLVGGLVGRSRSRR